MTISSESEFEAVISTVIVHVSKLIFAQAGNAQLEDARRKLDMARDVLRDKGELSEAVVAGLDKAATVLREKVTDEKMVDHLWDISDYIEMRLGKD